MQTTGPDPHSYANCNDVVVTYYDIHLRTDFTKQILHGDLYLEVKVKNPTDKLYLDIKSLKIESVTEDDYEVGSNYDDITLPWAITKTHPFGDCLEITIPENARNTNSTFPFQIKYTTTPESDSIQWLEPSQTAGKQYPYCYT